MTEPNSRDSEPSPRPAIFYFRSRGLLIATIWYMVLLIVLSALVLISLIFYAENIHDIRLISILSSVFAGTLGSAIFYLRKLYKSGFNATIVISNDHDTQIKRVSTVSYIYGRPLIASAISGISGIVGVLANTTVLPAGVYPTINLIYLTAIIGFTTGFLVGRRIASLEKESMWKS